jgi:DNA invertase Pin-like site-specific DNA recombinase
MVGYFRISNGKSGGADSLGIDGQKHDVAEHVAANGCDLIASYTEVETGKKHTLDNRPALRNAIAHAKRSKAILVVARLDRLLRSTVVHSLLKTSGVRFVACDQVHATEFTLDILAAVAEEECRTIGKRTKKALAALKRDGVVLGAARPECANNLTRAARLKGAAAAAKAHREHKIAAYDDLLVTMTELRDRGLSFQAIADKLNADGHTTRRGKPWNDVQAMRVCNLAAAACA